jgi:hypothetical protein
MLRIYENNHFKISKIIKREIEVVLRNYVSNE